MRQQVRTSNNFYTFNCMKRVRVRQTRYTGKGVFAHEDISSGETIFIVTGQKVRNDYGEDFEVGERWLGVGKNTWIDVSPNNPMYHLNHSCTPNATIHNAIEVVALRNIHQGEEITFDYSLTEEDPYWQMACNCHSDNCRGILRAQANFIS